MPPRKRSGDHLTEQDLIDLSTALDAGKRATVYLIDATPSLGIPAGCSAKVVSIDGSTVLIRPKGVNDELPYEADELRLTRQPAKAAPARAAAKSAATSPATQRPSTVKDVEARAAASRASAAPKAATPKPGAPAPAAPKSVSTAKAPTATTLIAQPKAPVTAPSTEPAATTPAPAKRARRAKDPASVSVTLHAEAGNEWTVTVTHGERRPGKAAPVTADAVERAVAELGDTTAQQAVAAVLSAAREAAAQRVDELSRQLAEAKSALESLGADGA
ncbi:translation initiation factor [Rhodococcus spelaei]|uniref:Translation initiation factor n=1 Tax=Rhodococcus spelaei TaxID=2546320 RepID=A0A541B9Y6_9NOCA|nr:translation initiation factor [Rhodococcus spelaei]TQF69048.1 translation initiation factor [Rhodococcus spelaei]